MEQIYKKLKEMTLYMCNPDLNVECDKSFCKHNTNALDHCCECTTKKEFALKIGEVAAVKDYTPRSKKNRVLILSLETGVRPRQIREKSRVIKNKKQTEVEKWLKKRGIY